MAQFIDAGEKERAIQTGTRILRVEPMHEATIRRLMQLYNESSRRGAAVHVYRTFAHALKKEFNAEPEAETSRVFADITQGEQDPNIALVKPEGDVGGQSCRIQRMPSSLPMLCHYQLDRSLRGVVL